MNAISALTGGIATIETVANGGGFEICNTGDVCKYPVNPEPPGPNEAADGSIGRVEGIALEQSTGNVFVSDQDNQRVSVYGADGSFQGAIGWGVIPGDTAPFPRRLHYGDEMSDREEQGPNGETIGRGAPALDPSTGDLFDTGQQRVNEYDLTHDISGAVTGATFVRAFGGDAVSTGPDDTGTNEQQTVTIPETVTSGTFTLKLLTAIFNRFNGQSSGKTNDNFITTEPLYTRGVFKAGELITSPQGGIPAGTTITEVDSTSGKLTLSNNLTSNITNAEVLAYEQTHAINYNANANTGSGAANLQESLGEVPAIGTGNLAVSGGPGATNPFTLTFNGRGGLGQ